jgi:hypothetical protein
MAGLSVISRRTEATHSRIPDARRFSEHRQRDGLHDNLVHRDAALWACHVFVRIWSGVGGRKAREAGQQLLPHNAT